MKLSDHTQENFWLEPWTYISLAVCSELIPHHKMKMAPGKIVFRTCRSHGMRRRISELTSFGPPPRHFRCSPESPCIVPRSHGMPRRISELISFGPPPKRAPRPAVRAKPSKVVSRVDAGQVPSKVRAKTIKIAVPVAVANRMRQIAAPDNHRPTIKFRINKKRSMHRPRSKFARNVLQPAHQPLTSPWQMRIESDTTSPAPGT